MLWDSSLTQQGERVVSIKPGEVVAAESDNKDAVKRNAEESKEEITCF